MFVALGQQPHSERNTWQGCKDEAGRTPQLHLPPVLNHDDAGDYN